MIICARYILPMDGNFIYDGAILTSGEFIKAIGLKKNIIALHPGEPVEDLGEAIIFPGFVNAHTHLEYSSIKISPESLTFTEWLPKIINKCRNLKFEDWEKSAQEGIEKLNGSGITTIADISRSGASIKPLSLTSYNSFVFHEVVAIDDKNIENVLSDLTEKIKNTALNEKIHIGISPHSLYTLSLDSLNRIVSFSRTHSLPIMIHVSETKEEMELIAEGTGQLKEIMEKSNLNLKYGYKRTPIQIMADNNILGPSTIIVHGVHLTHLDISLLKVNNTSVVLCPRSNSFLKVGDAPVSGLFQAGVCIGLGTDSLASNTSFNMFEEMRALKKLYPEIGYKTLLTIATLNNAKILKISTLTGSITPGKYVDINAVKIDNSSSNPNFNPYEYICESGQIENICFSMARGKKL